MATPDPSDLGPSQRARIRRLSVPKEGEPGEESGELNVVPYLDIIMNVMMFMLAAVSIVFASTVDAQAAAAPGPLASDSAKGLRFTAVITHDGVGLTTSAGHIAPGCEAIGVGVTVPKRDGAQDYPTLTDCARRIKASRPDLQLERQVTVTASPDVSYDEVIAVMDSLRADPTGELFPTVAFGVAHGQHR
jgi:biopolymer transport protein ExbD